MYRVANYFIHKDVKFDTEEIVFIKSYYIKTKDLLGFLRAKRGTDDYKVDKVDCSLIYDYSDKYFSDIFVVTKIA